MQSWPSMSMTIFQAILSAPVQIHTGSPWVQSRPVFVLIQQQPGTDVPLTYTLKTKVSWAAAEDELSKVRGPAFGLYNVHCAMLQHHAGRYMLPTFGQEFEPGQSHLQPS